jgi:TetR/AcrR family fatty acid metabolism transcriptional regulator
MKDAMQELLITARRNQILDAAAVVFTQKGFHPTTIRDVAREAGVADGTIYNYFESKAALLMGIFERMRASAVQQAALPPSLPDQRAFLRLMIHHPLNALRDNDFALFRIVISEMMVNEELRTLYARQILAPTLAMAEEYLAQQGYGPDHSRLVVRAVSGMVLGLIVEYVAGDATLRDAWDTLPDALADLMLHGLEGLSS